MSPPAPDTTESPTLLATLGRVSAFAMLVLAVVASVLGAPTWGLIALALTAVGCTVLIFRPPWAGLFAIAAAALGAAALMFDAPGPRRWFGCAALVCGLIFWGRVLVLWFRARGTTDADATPRGWPYFVGQLCSSALALAGALIGSAFVIGGFALASRREPIPLGVMYGGLIVLALCVLAVCFWWMRSFGRDVIGEQGRWWLAFACSLAVVVGGLVLLSNRDITNEREGGELSALREAALGQFDLMLVIDPADPASQRLIEAARTALEPTRNDPLGDRGDALLAPRFVDSPYDVAFGVAVVESDGRGNPLWRLVEPPTQDTKEVVASLATIPETSEAPSPAGYSRVLQDAPVQPRIRWREGAQRGIAFVLDRLPTVRELDHGAGAATPDEDDPNHLCTAARDAEGGDVSGALPPTARVTWGEGLRRLCLERQRFEMWTKAGRPRESRTLPPISLFAFTHEREPARLDDWTTWARATGGRVHILPPSGQFGDAAAVELLKDARDLVTGQPVGNLAEVVRTFRPHLLFDESETFFPVDVDWMLYPDARRPRAATQTAIECTLDRGVPTTCEQVLPEPSVDSHSVCDRNAVSENCEPIASRASLAGSLDEMIDFAGGAHLGADVVQGGLDPPRMYVHVREGDGRIFLGYWWYFRYNVSPWRTEVNCLPGLGFGGLSCHDHEGDWEGVTVVLKPLQHPRATDPYVLGNLQPEAVVYEAHGRPIRWEWRDVELAADADAYATHPVVYVAAGSHASYPARCTDPECDQRLSGEESLGEGGFDGAQPWRFNAQRECAKHELSRDTHGPCLVALPSTDGGARGVLWNAFPGAWGRARCTLVGKVCSQVDGPKSPGRQDRFRLPSRSRPGPRSALVRTWGDTGGPSTARGAERWPPSPWPLPPDAALPTTARLPE